MLKPGATTSAEELAEFVDALPISGAGKVLQRELRAKYWAGAERQVD